MTGADGVKDGPFKKRPPHKVPEDEMGWVKKDFSAKIKSIHAAEKESYVIAIFQY